MELNSAEFSGHDDRAISMELKPRQPHLLIMVHTLVTFEISSIRCIARGSGPMRMFSIEFIRAAKLDTSAVAFEDFGADFSN